MTEHKKYCTFTVGDYCFGVDVTSVREVLRYQTLTGVPRSHSAIGGLINLRGEIITAIQLKSILGIPSDEDCSKLMNLVVSTADGPVSLLINEIGEVVEVSEDQFEASPGTVSQTAAKMLNGAYKLKDRLVLILDIGVVTELAI